MIVLSLHDETQKIICGKLAYTEYMLNEVLKKINSGLCCAEITALEDLGLSNNIIRMRGGFYTGINIRWESSTPFIPVDTTVNSCGVSIFKYNGAFEYKEFQERMFCLDEKLKSAGIINNFSRGNHFIALCVDSNGVRYLVLHASDNKYKYGNQGLYPREDTWYFDQIRTESFSKGYIRYIIGNTAEKFYQLYLESEEANPLRNKIVAEIILEGCSNIEEVMYSPHYGMPDISSISIGSQWRKRSNILLSYEGAPIYIIRDKESRTKYMPHGFGLTIKGKCNSLEFLNQEIIINDIEFDCKDGLMEYGITKTRNTGEALNCNTLRKFMPSRTIEIVNELKQVYSFTRNGVKNYE